MILNSRPKTESALCRTHTFLRLTIRRTGLMLLAAHVLAYYGAVGPAAARVSQPAPVQENRRDGVQAKIDRIAENGSKSPVRPQSTVFSEDEVNYILQLHMHDLVPHGLSDPQVSLIGDNALVARVNVDLDEYKRRRQGRRGLGPLTLLSGRVPVTARGRLHVREGQGQFKLNGADVNGIPLPPVLVREMITVLSRSARNPEGYDIERPFILPAQIRSVTIHPKQAVVTQ